MAIKFTVVLGMLCLVGVYIQKELCEARSSSPSFAGQFGFTSNGKGFGFGINLFVDMVADALAGPRGRWISCSTSLYCRVSGNGLCCCTVFDFPQCVATVEECTIRIGGVDYYGYCLDPE